MAFGPTSRQEDNMASKIASTSSGWIEGSSGDHDQSMIHNAKTGKVFGIKTFLYLSLFGLLLLCSVQTYVQMDKYLNEQTTIAQRVDSSQDFLDFPAVSFCPGFKPEKAKELGWPLGLWDYYYAVSTDFSQTFPTTREEADSVWDSLNFSADEIFTNIGTEYHVDPDDNGNYTVVRATDLLESQVGCLSMEQHDTMTGRCFTITTWCKVDALRPLIITLNFTGMADNVLPMALHHPKAYLGNNINFFPGPVEVQDIASDTLVDLVAHMRINKREDGMLYDSEDDFYDCVMDAVDKSASKALTNESCYSPLYRSILGVKISNELQPCRDASQFTNMFFSLTDTLNVLYRDHGCPKPREETSYNFGRREHKQVMYTTPRSTLVVMLGSTDIITDEEYNLQDVYALVATVGGSVGVFLGWSLLDLARLVGAGIAKIFK